MGIQIGAGHHNVVVGNRIRHADRMGLDISAYGPLSGVVAARNRINDAGKDGILVRSVFKHAKQVRLRANRVAGSGDDGIDVAIKSATLTGNGAFRNGDHGIEAIEGVKDGGGNRARGNGNPEQCKSVVCT
jgi:hypothetical protein